MSGDTPVEHAPLFEGNYTICCCQSCFYDRAWNAALDAAAKAAEYQLGGHRDAFERGLHDGAVAVILALKR